MTWACMKVALGGLLRHGAVVGSPGEQEDGDNSASTKTTTPQQVGQVLTAELILGR
jgi:hypothetical protein